MQGSTVDENRRRATGTVPRHGAAQTQAGGNNGRRGTVPKAHGAAKVVVPIRCVRQPDSRPLFERLDRLHLVTGQIFSVESDLANGSLPINCRYGEYGRDCRADEVVHNCLHLVTRNSGVITELVPETTSIYKPA